MSNIDLSYLIWRANLGVKIHPGGLSEMQISASNSGDFD